MGSSWNTERAGFGAFWAALLRLLAFVCGGLIRHAEIPTETLGNVTLCQRERGADSLVAVFMGEDGEEYPFDGVSVGEDAHGPGSPTDLAEAAFDGVGAGAGIAPTLRTAPGQGAGPHRRLKPRIMADPAGKPGHTMPLIPA